MNQGERNSFPGSRLGTHCQEAPASRPMKYVWLSGESALREPAGKVRGAARSQAGAWERVRGAWERVRRR